MPTQSAQQLSANRTRLLKDRVARYGVSAGGVMVLVALLLIFFYLLYVIQPIFEPVKLKPEHELAMANMNKVAAYSIEEQAELGYQLLDNGEMQFFSLLDKQNRETGELLLTRQLLDSDTITSFAKTIPVTNHYVYGTNDGQALVVQPKFSVSFPKHLQNQQTRTVERVIDPFIAINNDEQPWQVDPQGRPLQQIAYETNGDGHLFAAVVDQKELLITHYAAQEDFLTGDISITPHYASVSLANAIDEVLVTPNLSQVLARVDNRLYIYDIDEQGEVNAREPISLRANSLGQVTKVRLLAGASSVLVAHQGGLISQWFEVPSEEGRHYQYIRQFDAGSTVVDIAVEYYRRTFYTLSDNGDINVFHSTSEADLYRGQPVAENVTAIQVDPRANHLMLQTESGYQLVSLFNEHPEVTWNGLWNQIWYEGYPEPQYTWQSTSGADDFEPKFSLMPIAFGTIKAAAYAMLFAVPIGLAAAIYTAYFMSPSVRQFVKPTVEIMEALPTVILGFLAGLWLAPLVEAYLPGFVATLILMPIGIVLTAAAWGLLPISIKSRYNDGRAAIILIPIVIAVTWLSFELSPWLEQLLFDGDTRRFITNELGIDYDQRNSLVVGIAMGFAVIPTVFSIAEDAVFSVPKHLSNGSLALGATPWQTLIKVVLLTASPGIFSAVMMGFGRAVGETMIVLMATGNTPIMDWNIFEGMRTLSANIAVEMPESEVGSSHYRILFLAAFVLFVFTFFFNTLAEFVRQRLRDKYSSL